MPNITPALVSGAFMILVLLIVGGIMWNEWRKSMRLKEYYRQRRENFDAECARIIAAHKQENQK